MPITMFVSSLTARVVASADDVGHADDGVDAVAGDDNDDDVVLPAVVVLAMTVPATATITIVMTSDIDHHATVLVTPSVRRRRCRGPT